MKRHPSLRDLSSDHHHGLVHALHLLRAGEGDTPATEAEAETARAFLAFFAEEANRHFREEEEVLLPAFARYGDVTGPAVVRVLTEHILVRRLVDDLAAEMDAGRIRRHDPRLILLAAYSMVTGLATEVEVLRTFGEEATLASLVRRRDELISLLRDALVPGPGPGT